MNQKILTKLFLATRVQLPIHAANIQRLLHVMNKILLVKNQRFS